jgi:hypothetical protein
VVCRSLWHLVMFLHLNLAFDLGPIINYIRKKKGSENKNSYDDTFIVQETITP